ncbi:hypothetical protein [Poseidonibacter ostreae]|uniref:Uncharacterized protein n=1 Tax=Poseidonibacter ostreae TaxID=2654171 RepID=A0A6L4WWX6_9BACT|nr:hypothetical protein [Poseidonibacter ostreae]KAB7891359.1 hypothetical protein GBG19_00555 [Poseidonibacter ostreae]
MPSRKTLSPKRQEQWNQAIKELDNFIQEYGVKNITRKKAPQKVYNFFRHKKEDFRNGKLLKSQLLDLKKIGVVFTLEGYDKEKFKRYSNNSGEKIEGKKFNYLTVVEKTNKPSSSGSLFYLCKCDCGKETLALRCNLKSGKKKTCGTCDYSHRKYHLKDYIDKKFGMLLILNEKEEKIKSKVFWSARCECGNITKVSTSNLFSSKELVNVLNCGCLNKKHNKKVMQKAVRVQKELRDKGLYSTSVVNAKMKKRSTNKSGFIGVYITKELILSNGTIQKSFCKAKIAFKNIRTEIGKYEPTERGLLQGAIDRDIYIIEHNLPHTRNFTDKELIDNIRLSESSKSNEILNLVRKRLEEKIGS